MRLQIDSSFEDYIGAGDTTTGDLLNGNGPSVQALRAQYRFFAQTLWANADGLRPIPAMMGLNAFMLLLAGVRVALTGHAAATFPVLRTALESACYALLMTCDESLEGLWTARHKDEEGRRACRRAFGSAVRDAVTKLNEIQEDSGNWILEGYEAAIDFGAHPNTRSVMGHLSFKHENDGGAAVTLTGLYGPTAWETERTLLACLEYGLAIAIVLARCLDAPSADVEGALFQLSADKEALVANLKGA